MPFITVAGPVPVVGDFLGDATRLNEAEFVSKHPSPVFLVSARPPVELQSALTASTVTPVGSTDAADVRAWRESTLAVPVLKGPLLTPATRPRVGRAPINDVALPFSSVSKVHAFLRFIEGENEWTIEDAGSRNGTRVNGQRLAPNDRARLRDGDAVQFGDVKTTFRNAQGFYAEVRILARMSGG